MAKEYVYYGSYSKIDKPIISRGKFTKDFGDWILLYYSKGTSY